MELIRKIEVEGNFTKIVDLDNDIGVSGESVNASGGADIKIWDTGDKIEIPFNLDVNEYTIKVRGRCQAPTATQQEWYKFEVNGKQVNATVDITSISSLQAGYGGSYWGFYVLDKLILKGDNKLTIEALALWGGVDVIEIYATSAPVVPKYTLDQLISIAKINGTTEVKTAEELFHQVRVKQITQVVSQLQIAAQKPFEINVEGVLLRGNVVIEEPNPTVPNAPQILSASNVTTSSFVANWMSVVGAVSYRLDVSTNSNFSSFVTGYNNLSITLTSREVTGLSDDTNYYYRVRAVGPNGTSVNSSVISVQTLEIPVTPPETVNLTISFTNKELDLWRTRWESGGSFRGDRARIITYADALKANPTLEDYNGPSVTPVVQWSTPEPLTQGMRMVCCAWRGVVGNKVNGVWQVDLSYINAVKTAILNAVGKSGMDSTNTARWQTGKLIDVNPSFSIAEYLNRVLVAYTYVKDYFSSSQQTTINTWFQNWANWFSVDLNNSMNSFFVDRWNGNYTVKNSTSAASHHEGDYTHDGGYRVNNMQVHWNNRRGSIARFIGYVGILLNNETNKKTARLYFLDCIKYGMWENGMVSDMYRGWNFAPNNASSPAWEQGFAYSMAMITAILGEIADIFARNGDSSLYDYSTTFGQFGTEAPSGKSLKKSIDLYAKMFAKEIDIRVNGERLDGVRGNWVSAQDLMFSKYNIKYKDSWLTQVYKRQLPGQNPIPANPAGNGSIPANMGAGGLAAGFSIMYEDAESLSIF